MGNANAIGAKVPEPILKLDLLYGNHHRSLPCPVSSTI
jgi:hypothetical protein